jgi:UDP-N-acetylmuramate--alanine ligase
MSKVNIDKISRVHFIGIGGIGMSALARFLMNEKKTVSGSDRALTPITKALSFEGVQIFSSQVAENISSDIELVIYTEAMSQDHEEMIAAKALGVPRVNYFEALGLVANPYYLIAVAGTHGKTTTTAMLTDIFETNEKDPTAIIGSLRAKTQSNFRAGKSKYAIVEACEYKRDFLFLKPDVLVITNIEFEHSDCYEDLADVQRAFRQLIEQVNEEGVVVTNTKDPNIAPILVDCPVRVVDYLEYFDVSLQLKQPGIHNRFNAAAAIAAARQEKIPVTASTEAVAAFTGTWRRFEFKGDFQEALVYDDYAHHPTAIRMTIAGARELYPDKKIITVFEPHLFSRTESLFEDFARSFIEADHALLLPIYAAREDNTRGVTSRELAVKAFEFNPYVLYVPTYDEAIAELGRLADKDSVILVLGAGDITKLAAQLVTK